jgi:hypothetical protein
MALDRIRRYAALVWANVFFDAAAMRFMKHCRSIWKRDTARRSSGEVLFEQNEFHSAIIAYSYLANVLANRHDADITRFRFPNRRRGALLDRLTKRLSDRIYESFNCGRLVVVAADSQQKREADTILRRITPGLITKLDLENLTIDGIWIGDLAYDTYLKERRAATVDLESPALRESLREAIEIFVFWRDYLRVRKVKAVNVSHCVYNVAIVLRIAVAQRIPVYQINATHAYRLDEKNLFAYTDFFYYRDAFRALSPQVRREGIATARSRIERRFKGEVGVDMPYSSKSAYGAVSAPKPVLRASPRPKVLIALHCFFDSPHSYGVNLFPDFYDWLDYLGRISEETDYDWYLKTHPDVLSGNEAVIESFVAKYPKFTLLPRDTSHHQIIRDGIDVALTVYGTIAFEYAALGLPVVNASQCNPHVSYNFSLHPKSIDEYGQVLRSLAFRNLKIDQEQVYEFYFMRFIYNSEDWLFRDYSAMVDALGGYGEQFTPRVYDYFLREFTPERHAEVAATIERFVETGDFRLSQQHMRHANTPSEERPAELIVQRSASAQSYRA